MNVRPEVAELALRGRFPSELSASEAELREIERLLSVVKPPLTTEEAELLLPLFGVDTCFGLGWALLHLLESTPGGVIREPPAADGPEWHRRLWARAHR